MKKPIIQVILFVLLAITAYFVGHKLGQGQIHQRIADAWNEIIGEEAEAVDDIQDPFGEDPFGPINANDPFANSRGPFLGGNASGNGNDLPERLETNATKLRVTMSCTEELLSAFPNGNHIGGPR